ncbi:MAG: fabA, partial [bacterium]
MSAHFRAFSFVDRIESARPGVDIRGHYLIPTTVPGFPGSLVAEAVGQLAAWSSLSANGFARRPLAGIAGRIEILAAGRPGQVLDLAAEIEHLDDTAVTYHGTASVDGRAVLRLH